MDKKRIEDAKWICEKMSNKKLLDFYESVTRRQLDGRYDTKERRDEDIEIWCIAYGEVMRRMEDGIKMRDLFKEE